jgi:hypothetical protein
MQEGLKKSDKEVTQIAEAISYDAAGACVDVRAVLKDLKVVPGASLLPLLSGRNHGVAHLWELRFPSFRPVGFMAVPLNFKAQARAKRSQCIATQRNRHTCQARPRAVLHLLWTLELQ